MNGCGIRETLKTSRINIEFAIIESDGRLTEMCEEFPSYDLKAVEIQILPEFQYIVFGFKYIASSFVAGYFSDQIMYGFVSVF
jgi:hypothetical protein